MMSYRTFTARRCALPLCAAISALVALAVGRAEAAATQVTGTIVLTFKIATALPNGTVVSVLPLVSPNDTVYSDGTSSAGTATVAGGQATVSIRVPYSWRVSSTADKVAIVADVSGYATTSAANLSNSTYFSSTIALPKNGATTTVSYTGTL